MEAAAAAAAAAQRRGSRNDGSSETWPPPSLVNVRLVLCRPNNTQPPLPHNHRRALLSAALAPYNLFSQRPLDIRDLFPETQFPTPIIPWTQATDFTAHLRTNKP